MLIELGNEIIELFKAGEVKDTPINIVVDKPSISIKVDEGVI